MIRGQKVKLLKRRTYYKMRPIQMFKINERRLKVKNNLKMRFRVFRIKVRVKKKILANLKKVKNRVRNKGRRREKEKILRTS